MAADTAFTLAAMTEADLPDLLRFWRGIEGLGLSDVDAPEPLARYLARNPGLSVAARGADGRVAGAALCGHDGRRGYLHHLAVAPDRRGHGLGRRLLDHCLAGLAKEGIVRCHLFDFAANDAGLAFYEKAGWRRRGDLCLFSRDT